MSKNDNHEHIEPPAEEYPPLDMGASYGGKPDVGLAILESAMRDDATPPPTPAAANAVDAAPSFADLARYNAEAHIANAHIETLDKLAAADAELATLRARVEALEKDLAPFARFGAGLGDGWHDEFVMFEGRGAKITVSDLRRAAAQARGGEGN